MDQDNQKRLPNCLKCLYYQLTWEHGYPHSCGIFGIKSRNLPGMEVFLATGRHCPSFHVKIR
ncbi:MAG: hypothetical protein LBP88_04600 [Treponema sp.]|nr:hypothetical protein [Treponema sp.]